MLFRPHKTQTCQQEGRSANPTQVAGLSPTGSRVSGPLELMTSWQCKGGPLSCTYVVHCLGRQDSQSPTREHGQHGKHPL